LRNAHYNHVYAERSPANCKQKENAAEFCPAEYHNGRVPTAANIGIFATSSAKSVIFTKRLVFFSDLYAACSLCVVY